MIGEDDIKGEAQETTDVTTQPAQRNADVVVDGTLTGQRGGK